MSKLELLVETRVGAKVHRIFRDQAADALVQFAGEEHRVIPAESDKPKTVPAAMREYQRARKEMHAAAKAIGVPNAEMDRLDAEFLRLALRGGRP
jgi:hypothetical protein